MAKFSDSSYNILKTYFDDANYQTTSTSASSAGNRTTIGTLIGQNTGIVAKGGYWFDFYIMDSNGFKKVRFSMNKSNYLSDNYFYFTKHPDDEDFEVDSEVYFRCNSYFHEWLKKYSLIYKYFVNTKTPFIYFGKIYPSGDNYSIKFYGMKDYVMDALPEHNRTTKLREFMKLFFDKIYHKIYNLSKNAKTLMDPMEIDIDYLGYLADTYSVTLRDTLNEQEKREFVRNIIYLLKRKGTYASIYIIWKLISNDPYNNINVYERCHEQWNISPTLPYFNDVIYTGYYDSYKEGCAGNKYYISPKEEDSESPSFYFYTKDSIVSSPWSFSHSLGTKEILAMFYNGKTIIRPYSFEVTSSDVTVGYDGIESCSVILVKSESNHTQSSSSTSWNVNHGLNSKEVIVQAYDSNDMLISSYDVSLIDENNCTVTFNDSINGMVNIIKPEYTHTQLAESNEWNIKHDLTSNVLLIQCYNNSYEKIRPESIVVVDINRAKITFDDDINGFAFIYGTTIDSESSEHLSTHYRVEIDLNCSPLGDNYIINEETERGLYQYWEMTRPVSRVSHYNLLIAPKTDFTKRYVSNYNYNNTPKKGKIETKCCVDTFVKIEGIDLYFQKFLSEIWSFYHTLDTTDLIVQCYDINKNKIIPKDIQILNNYTVIATFSSKQNGYMVIKTADYVHTQTLAASATWDINHSLNYKENITQIYNENRETELPKTLTLVDLDNELATFSQPLSGYSHLVKASYIYTGNSSTTWNIYHNLESQLVFIQCYDSNYNLIIPKEIILNSENNCTVTFNQNQSGYALIYRAGQPQTQYSVMSNMASGGYLKLGTGTSGESWNTDINNDIENNVYRVTDVELDYDEDNYYVECTAIAPNLETDITEFGLFDKNNNLIFYSYCDPIYKMKEFGIKIFYRIER
jgi:hypothetical protein